jgi:hypothetical protein
MVVGRLFKKDDVELDSKDSGSRISLWLAAREEYEAVAILLLLDSGTEHDFNDGNSRTPPSWVGCCE